ncbi:hypothetical protein GRX03_15095 [Halovenus sp. WSH3]|uniref:Uncharacterized protein n=1 Tax=Halovenus carboxidivorans TaxID=2692199 RepID=A0A6B0T4E0_9EURY|nr:hypothetical protein [Halovenus carboxidivorans]MXR52924.1 hypothetical protein [Halovenus carboxidivorans]
MRSALAIGGISALSTALGVGGVPSVAAAEDDHEPISFAARDNRQHAWDGYEKYFPQREQTLPPEYHLLLHVDYLGDGEPTAEDRETVAQAFRDVERTFEWSHEGILFTVSYSPAYFDRFDESLPQGIGPATEVDFDKPSLLRPETLIDLPGVTLERERPVEADTFDACIHLASDDIGKLLLAEAMLWDDYDPDTVWEDAPPEDPEPFEHTLDGILSKPVSYPERRVGFAGHENVEERLAEDTEFDADRVPDEDEFDDEVGAHPAAELSMGFNDQYKNSLPRETNVTLLEDQRLVVPKDPGVFAQGTIQHVSKLNIDLEGFYDDNDRTERRERMFSPDHDDENTGAVGENLGNSNAPGETPMRDVSQASDDPTAGDKARETQPDWDDEGVVGHAQKVARARFDMETRITDEGQERLSGGDRDELLPAEERDDELPGHDGDQETEGVMLRRDFAGTAPAAPDEDRVPGNHFVALMRFNPYMAYMRQAMNGVPLDSATFGLTDDGRIDHRKTGAVFDDDGNLVDVDENSGIAHYLTTQRRGNYLVPPLTQRALPYPQADNVEIDVKRAGENYRVTVEGLSAGDLADGTVRFGWFYDVNRSRGAEPRQETQRGNRTTFVFPADETGIETAPGGPDGDVRVRLYAERDGTRRPVRGTATIDGKREDASEQRKSGEKEDRSKADESNGRGQAGRTGSDRPT